MAKTDADGWFVITDLPTGEHTFQLWHERVGYPKSLHFGSRVSAKRGRLTLKIQKGENVLGDAKLSPSLFDDE